MEKFQGNSRHHSMVTMSSASNLSHRRTHNLLLISKLLSLRDTASPLTLVLDSLEQPGKPLLNEYIRRTQISKVHVTFIAFETLERPNGVDSFILATRKKPTDMAKEIAAGYSNSSHKRRLIIIDAINPLLSKPGIHLPSYFGSLIAPVNPSPSAAPIQTSLVVTYHRDVVPVKAHQSYAPPDLSVLSYLSTTIITLHPLSHILAQKAAHDRSLAAPVFGLEEQQEGIIIGRINDSKDRAHVEGIVLELEHRRKSGRGVVEWYFMPPAGRYSTEEVKEVITLLEDHPLYRRPDEDVGAPEQTEPGSTFELKLTERQRRDREGVVLPYFDAQSGDGPGEGGRILYDMGEEDDFDEEEDEI
ncbi:killer toxin sensitivity protein (Iki1), putative [Talaromyces stipitatus ATCC 10500]|uniref:Elongator complex protein 5 n=1 Tax=Talaromyces stipitatus (strain ATCC 10500 / CBS 375.48 / QM 6759 / NRRL 1006) TaxID=441959 RepID=B8M6B8_TALSN|nr:killer toxin sensitivity protein (Iki1), putative [Talaromyces stipitatus ATCC 10500]EED19293.1 killer toxin sensitivity protein (Iki1), putative [Talaromyces stipitatus ATCC 10500]